MRVEAGLTGGFVRSLGDAPEERANAQLRDLTPPIAPERPAVTLAATPDMSASPPGMSRHGVTVEVTP